MSFNSLHAGPDPDPAIADRPDPDPAIAVRSDPDPAIADRPGPVPAIADRPDPVPVCNYGAICLQNKFVLHPNHAGFFFSPDYDVSV